MATAVGTHLFRDEISEQAFGALVRDALNFDVPLRPVTDRIWALELFHGPTLAFKDIGARVQARLLHHFTDGTPLTILVATSGDTGSAVAQAFYGVPDTRVVVLYRRGRSATCRKRRWRRSAAISARSRFGHVRRLPAAGEGAFADDDLRQHVWLTPANSINVGRLLPQVFYYFQLLKLERPLVSVPSGNFGNLTAGLIAKRHRPARAPVRRGHEPERCRSEVPPVRPIQAAAERPHHRQRDGRRRAKQLRAHPVALDPAEAGTYDSARDPSGHGRRGVRRSGGPPGDRRRVPSARVPDGSARCHRRGWR